MPARGGLELQTYTSFGALLRFLRRRAQLTQRDLGIAVGYSEGHINRFEHGKHWPDPAAVAALFVPALYLNDEPDLAARLIGLAAQGRHAPPEAVSSEAHTLTSLLEPIPPSVQAAVTRADAPARLRAR
ncbi:MAG: helix-turn-helix transcriptional regulator, partial [Thermoflexales bacterium]|nr:helix-turn-helix transcriptional regulator [Thermoflexales bacterium]